MNPHDEFFLDAYLDGALDPTQARRLEAHLAHCPDCQIVLRQRRALAVLLHSAPGAELRKSENRFVAEINLQMPRHAPRPARNELTLWSWQLIPVGLLVGMIFLQIALWGAAIFDWVPGAHALFAGFSEWSLLGGFQPALPTALTSTLNWLGPLNYWSMSWLAGLAVLLLFALMYLGWLASWWTRSRSH